jgi:hypothetical protein
MSEDKELKETQFNISKKEAIRKMQKAFDTSIKKRDFAGACVAVQHMMEISRTNFSIK